MGTQATWAVGVTTVGDRIKNGLLERTLRSLYKTGFPEPRIFIDGPCEFPDWLCKFELSQRIPRLRVAGNWVVSAWELFLHNRDADYFAMFQDDVVCCRNLREYCESISFPEKGYLNLYTHPRTKRKNLHGRFHQSTQRGKGALALVFSNESLRLLLSADHLVFRMWNVPDKEPKRRYKLIDGGILESFRKAKGKEYVHTPSLVQHTGKVSTVSCGGHPLGWGFPGENFDALSFLTSSDPAPPTSSETPSSSSQKNPEHGETSMASPSEPSLQGTPSMTSPSEPSLQETSHVQTCEEALSHMLSPGERRTHKAHGGIIQVLVTRACDKQCYACTQGSQLRGPPRFISLESFEEACISLKPYYGVVGVFGGNPCLHPKFPELCEIFAKYIPKHRRGIWTNALHGHGALCRDTFNAGVSNVNVHLDHKAAKEFHRDWPGVHTHGVKDESRHSPPFIAMRDIMSPEEYWPLVPQCDIHRFWSSILCEFRGVLKAYFCEIAGAQAVLHQDDPNYPDLGIEPIPGWWNRPITDFAEQVEYHCSRCSIPLRVYGELSQGPGTELTSESHASIFLPRESPRRVKIVKSLKEITSKDLKVTQYLQGAKK